jgi:hypothetical protein
MEVHATGRGFVLGKQQARKIPHGTGLDNKQYNKKNYY